MAITRVAGYPTVPYNGSPSASSLTCTVSPTALGNILVIGIKWGQPNSGKTVTGVSGGGITTWNLATNLVDATDLREVAIYWGKITTTGAQTLTVNFSGTTTDNGIVVADELHNSTDTDFSLVVAGPQNGGSASTTACLYPSLASGSNIVQAYWGIARANTAVSAGSTAGFTYTVVPAGGTAIVCLNVGLAANTSYQPGFSQLSASNYDGVGVIFMVLEPPVNTVAPAVTGTTNAGLPLSSTTGTWTG